MKHLRRLSKSWSFKNITISMCFKLNEPHWRLYTGFILFYFWMWTLLLLDFKPHFCVTHSARWNAVLGQKLAPAVSMIEVVMRDRCKQVMVTGFFLHALTPTAGLLLSHRAVLYVLQLAEQKFWSLFFTRLVPSWMRLKIFDKEIDFIV